MLSNTIFLYFIWCDRVLKVWNVLKLSHMGVQNLVKVVSKCIIWWYSYINFPLYTINYFDVHDIIIENYYPEGPTVHKVARESAYTSISREARPREVRMIYISKSITSMVCKVMGIFSPDYSYSMMLELGLTSTELYRYNYTVNYRYNFTSYLIPTYRVSINSDHDYCP